MAWVIRVKIGKGKNKSVSQSTPLPNKTRVRSWVRRHPMIKSNTKVIIKNTVTKKKIITTGSGAYFFGSN